MVQTFCHPRSADFSKEFDLSVNGKSIEILRTDSADFANFIFDPADGPAEVVITRRAGPISRASIRPLHLGIEGSVDGQTLRFQFDQPCKLAIEMDGRLPLFIWANPPERDRPDPDDPSVIYYPAGQTYEIGELVVESEQTVYIEGGAVVKGCIRAKNAERVSIRGHGVLDGSYYLNERGERIHSIRLDHCREIEVRDIVMIRPSTWMLVLAACQNATVRNLKQIGEVVTSDGIDIVGTSDVLIENCFLRNNDDCVVVKAFDLGRSNTESTRPDCRLNTENVVVRNCVLLNDKAGNAMEIGHELAVDYIRNVTFRDIDVLSVHGHGAVFSIHNYDRADVHDILFEDIRVEHCYDRLIDFRVSRSRFSSDEERGRIRQITLRNIEWRRQDVNVGYTTSVIGGWDEDHLVEDITLHSVTFNGQPVHSLDELDLYTRYTRRVTLLENDATDPRRQESTPPIQH